MAGTGILYYRKRKGLSQTALAKTLRIDGARMSRLESGESIPTAAEVDDLVKTLGVPPSHLFSIHVLEEAAERERAQTVAVGAGAVDATRTVLEDVAGVVGLEDESQVLTWTDSDGVARRYDMSFLAASAACRTAEASEVPTETDVPAD